MSMNPELDRLQEADSGTKPWKRWGPYLAERQWGTVREDYSPHGTAWEYLSHDAARSRAYRWGEDGIAGFSDDQQRLCFAIALWNERDPILKERLFGLTGNEGNHGEDVKEIYAYLDATPTHSFLEMAYKYPQAQYPYARLVEENRRRGSDEPELELLDTGVFEDDRYFDVFVTYAKAEPEDVVIAVTTFNPGPDGGILHLLPQAWFRNTWSWAPGAPRPRATKDGDRSVRLEHAELGDLYLHVDRDVEWLFCENETNAPRLFGGSAEAPFKDAFHEAIVHGNTAALSREPRGTKVAAHLRLEIDARGSERVLLRLRRSSRPGSWSAAASLLEKRREEADRFYEEIHGEEVDADARQIQRQALAGMIWSKQFYAYDVRDWLAGDPAQPAPPAERRQGRNSEWMHLNNADVLSMPDTWEYPWYAAWDLAFHTLPLAMIDPSFAKEQLVLLTREWYMHPSGQLPAYEWAFSDVNPPVHAWATWRVYEIDRARSGRGDVAFLERVFHKLLLNFTWWVNRKDPAGRNVFQGGFLGLDNIGVFDRSAPLPGGGHLHQSDATSWMAMYSLDMMRIALELAVFNPVYQDLATKFFEHFLYIAAAMNDLGGQGVGLWNEEDELFYDVLAHPDGSLRPLRLRSMVGLIPLFAVEVLDEELLSRVPEFDQRLAWFLDYRPDLAKLVSRWQEPGEGETHLLALLRGHRMKRVLHRMLDETEFLSPHGVRSLSKHHGQEPYRFAADGHVFEVSYQPAESESGLFGGNSNWRGPIWMPVNYLIIESLRKFHRYYGDDFRIECPTGSGELLSIAGVADELTRRLTSLFRRGADGRRPIFGASEKLQRDPRFREWLTFPEYFHGEDGRGLGASHQTGWTGLIAALLSADVQRSCGACAPMPGEIPAERGGARS